MKRLKRFLAGLLAFVLIFSTWGNLSVVNAASYTVTFRHYLDGFSGTGNVDGGNYYALPEVQRSLGTFTMTTGYATSVPNGFAIRTGYYCSNYNTAGLAETSSFYYHDYGSQMAPRNNSIIIWMYYDPVTYSVSYNMNGGTNNANNPTSYNVLHGKSLYNPTRTGYIFTGWTDQYGNRITSINGGASASFSSSTDLYNQLASRRTGNITLTANWQEDRRYITYDDNGGSGGPGTESFLLGYQYRISSKIPSRTGYTFNNWLDLYSGTSSVFAPGQAYPLGWGTNTMQARWTINSYNMTINPNGGLYNGSSASVTKTQNYGSSLSLSQPTRTGYTFLGWDLSGYGTNNGASNIPSNVNVTSGYTPIGVYNNTGNGNVVHSIVKDTTVPTGTGYSTKIQVNGTASPGYGGFYDTRMSSSGEILTHRFTAKVPKGLTLAIARNGCGDGAYDRWLTSNQGTGEWETYIYQTVCGTSGTFSSMGFIYVIDTGQTTPFTWYVGSSQVYNTKNVSYTFGAGAGTMTAQWLRNQYNVTYDANGGTLENGNSTNATSVYYADPVDLSHKAAKDGRVFLGWAESPTAQSCISSMSMPDRDVILYAIYSLPVSDMKEAHLVAWNKNNPSIFNSFEMNMTGTDINGYNYQINGINAIAGLSYGSTSEISMAIVLYDNAGNRSVIPVILPQTDPVPDVEEVPLPEKYLQTVVHYIWNLETEEWTYHTTTNALVEEGTVFTPAFLDENSELFPKGYYGDIIDKGYTVTDAKTVNAYYKPLSFKAYFDANGGTCDTSYKVVHPGYYYGELPTAERKGYDFIGWFTEADGGVKISDGDKFEGSSDITLYAHWEIRSHKVIYDYATNGGNGADLIEDTVNYGEDVDLGIGANKNGWEFVGWNTDPDAKTGLASCKMPDKELRLYAIFKKEIVATFIDKNDDGTVTREDKKTIYNKEQSTKIDVPEQNKLTGWDSSGWSEDTIGNAEVTASSGTTLTLEESITLYGCYMRDITLGYDGNGSASHLPDDTKTQYFNASENYLNPEFVIADAPVLDKHSFVQWVVTEGEEVGKTYAEKETVILKGNTILKAEWDAYPVLEAYDRYFTLEEAMTGQITPERLLENVIATDKEDGILENGSAVTIPAYQVTDFTSFTDDGSATVTYRAEDSFGNAVEKRVTIYIVDANSIEAKTATYIRFIDKEYYKDENSNYVAKEKGGLERTSKWIENEEYAAVLEEVLSYEKINMVSNTIDIVGTNRVVPDLSSGKWVNEKQSWTFTKNTIDDVKVFVDEEGFAKYENEDAIAKFYEKFEGFNEKNGS